MNFGYTEYINEYLQTDSHIILYEGIIEKLREIFLDLILIIYNNMSNWRFYFIATNYNTWNDEILTFNIEYLHLYEPYNIGRDIILNRWYGKVKWMYWLEAYALEALGLTK